jgi:hypothetical protein
MHPDAEPLATPPSSAETVKYAFVSYKREDQRRARRIVEQLRDAGVNVWWDDDIPGGEEWRTEIERRLQGASCVVVLWSKLSVGEQGRFVRAEAEIALERHIPLVPVLIDDVDVPLGFGEVHTIDLHTWEGDAADGRLVKLITDIRAKLGLPAFVPPAPRSRVLQNVLIASGIAVAAFVVPVALRTRAATRHSSHDAATVARLLTRLENGSRLENGVRVSAADRAFAIDSLHARTDLDVATQSIVHAKVLAFLAWRARRSVPFTPCSSSTSRSVANDLNAASDVRSALSFLRDTVGRASLATARPTILDGSNLQRMDFRRADLRRVSFRASCVDSTDFRDAWLQGSSFADSTEGRKTLFVRARLDSADFALSSLVGASFSWACLRYANFAGAQLERSIFRNTSISWANFSSASVAVEEGWSAIDTSASNAFFGEANGLTPSDSQWLNAHGATLSGMGYGAWAARRKNAVTGSTAAVCTYS